MKDNQFIKKLDDYFDIISEALKNPLDIKWVDKNNKVIGLFTVNNNIYQINCINKENSIWKYDFYFLEKNKLLSPKLTGLEKDKYRILPTVKVGLEHLNSLKKPDAIVFGATDKSKGRKKIYESFCIEFAKTNNFEFYTKMENDKQIFILYKNNIDRNILTKTVFNIIEEEKF